MYNNFNYNFAVALVLRKNGKIEQQKVLYDPKNYMIKNLSIGLDDLYILAWYDNVDPHVVHIMQRNEYGRLIGEFEIRINKFEFDWFTDGKEYIPAV